MFTHPHLLNAHSVAVEEDAQKCTQITPFPAAPAGNELCERLAYYGLATNLVTYITQVMGGDPAFAAIMVSLVEHQHLAWAHTLHASTLLPPRLQASAKGGSLLQSC